MKGEYFLVFVSLESGPMDLSVNAVLLQNVHVHAGV